MDSLVALGFSRLEAAIYVYLLEESPATGYQIAKAIEKPNANTYQALESMAQRGLLLVEDGQPRRYRAVPHKEMLHRLGADYTARVETASKDLDAIRPATGDLQVYRITEYTQVIERCRAMLARARRKVVVDAFPGVLVTMVDELEATAGRGTEVIAKAYEPVTVEGVKVVIDVRGRHIPDTWGIQWLNLVVDGREHLFACLDVEETRVIQAIWTESPYVAFLIHTGLLSEMAVDAILTSLEGTPVADQLMEILDELTCHDEEDLPGRLDLYALNATHHRNQR
jgi:sugar-specific transcriptional regulator TrmB